MLYHFSLYQNNLGYNALSLLMTAYLMSKQMLMKDKALMRLSEQAFDIVCF